MKLTEHERAAKGHAFDCGYEAQRAVRLYQDGIGHTPTDDLALALGYPTLVELAPDAEGDLVGLTRQRVNSPFYRAIPWPRNLAVRALRAMAAGWEQFPTTLSARAEAALANDAPFVPGELPRLLASMTRFQSASWENTLELLLLMEALAGGEVTIAAVCDLVESNVPAWNELESKRRTVLFAIGVMFDRLSAERAVGVRPRLEALLARYRDVDETGVDPARVGMPLRALDLALHGRAGFERSSLVSEWGRDRHSAYFLDREAFAALMTPPLKKPLSYMLPTVQSVVQGGVGELLHVGDPSRYKLRGLTIEAHRWVVDQFARLRAIEAAQLLATIASQRASLPLVVDATRRNPGLLASFERIAKDEGLSSVARKGAASVVSKARSA